MPRRRCLWFGLLLALGWGLWFFVPPSPRWTLPKYEIPLKANGTRLLTMVCRPGEVLPPSLPASVVGPVHLRDIKTGEIVAAMSPQGEGPDQILETSADLRFLLYRKQVDTEKEKNFIHDLNTGSCSLPTPPGNGFFSPSGALLVLFSNTQQERIFESATGKQLAEFPRRFILEAIAPDDSWAFCCHLETPDQWLLWQRDHASLLKGMFANGSKLRETSKGGRLGLIASKNGDTSIWDLGRGEELRRLKTECRDHVDNAFSEDGTYVCVAEGARKAICRFDLANGDRLDFQTSRDFYGCSMSPNGKFAACISVDDRTVTVIDLNNGCELWSRSHPDLNVTLYTAWMEMNRNRLSARTGVVPMNGAGARGTRQGILVWDGASGREIFHRPSGDFGVGEKHWIRFWFGKELTNGNFGLPKSWQRWLPFTVNDPVAAITVDDVDSDQEVLRRFQWHKVESPYELDWIYLDDSSLVLFVPDRASEIWDLPPPRPWLWILGPPAALAVMPSLFRRFRRKRSGPAASSGVAVSAAPTPTS